MKIDNTFKYSAYGVDVRLANFDDAEFILSLRTNDRLSRFIHSTDNDVEKQINWMKEYKKRELKGEDYYFVYSKNGVPFGVNRIYDISLEKNLGTGGSWLCKQGTDVEDSMATLIIMRDIMFDILGLDYDMFDVRKQNKKVQKIHIMLGAKNIGETELDYLYSLSKEDYKKNKDNFLQLLNIK